MDFAEFRKALGLSRFELASEIGVSESLIGQIETGAKKASHKFIKKFLSLYPKADIKKLFFDY